MENGEQNNSNQEEQSPRPEFRFFRPLLVWMLILGALLVFLMLSGSGGLYSGEKKLTYDKLLQEAEAGHIESIVIDKQTGAVRGEFRTSGMRAGEPTRFTSEALIESVDDALEPILRQKNVRITYQPPSKWDEVLLYFLPMLLLGVFFYVVVMRQLRGASGGPFAFGKSRAVRVSRDQNRKTFDDVAGVDEAREEVREIIEFLRNPERFQRLGGRLPKGVLLIGGPGTGKTLLAKAIAGEADVPFFSISGSDFVEMFVGVGASRVRDLFEQAKASSPCIIFLDEIDAVGRKRSTDIPGSGMEMSQTLNAILVEMDGFTSDSKVIVIAATNRPDVLDPALLRPGRFDRQITVDLPDIKGREAILKVHVKGIRLAEDVDLSVVARGTPTFSGAELENLVNEAALIAVMREKDSVDMESLEDARDKVRFGKEKRSRQMGEEDRRATAYHEAGHALLMRALPHVSPLHKVTIIPRGRALGATMQLPEKDEYSLGRRRVLGEITVFMGGRAAEELFLDDVTTGAAQDIMMASQYARQMICEWGMSDELGLVRYSDRGVSMGGMFEGREFSEATAERIDQEVRRITDTGYAEAREYLGGHRDEVDLLVLGLLEFETLSRDEVDMLLEDGGLDALREKRQAASKPKAADEDATGSASSQANEQIGPSDDAETDTLTANDETPAPDETTRETDA